MNTTLRDYLDELKLLLEQEALEEVMGHCRHILQHFPRNVETYRLLGRALLEKNRYSEAGDVFQRVLSALPDDFVSHLGMSGIAEEGGQIPTAIWHLERAYELEPNNAALRGEIKRLYERRDGASPERIELTRGGLAHIYAKGRLYDQAVSELQAAIEQMPERVDLLLLLATVLWENGHSAEACEIALQALEKLPDSLEANRIMASLWLQVGRPSDAAPFVTRLEQLDPFLAWATVNPDGKELPQDAFQLPRLDWDARAAAALATDVPDWVSDMGSVFEDPQSVATPSRADSFDMPAQDTTPVEIPDWFSDVSSAGQPAQRAAATPLPADDIPDWFRSEAAPTAASTPAAAPDYPDWLKDEEPSPTTPAATPTPAAAIPSWLADELPDLESVTGTPAYGSTAVPSEPAPASGGPIEIPDWLEDSEPAAEAAPVENKPALDALSWLSTGPLPPLEEALPAASAPTESSEPDWFAAEAPETAQPEQQVAPAQTSEDDWLSAYNEPATTSPEAEPLSQADSSFEAMFGEAAQPASEPDLAASALPDWLSAAAPSDLPVEAAASPIDLGELGASEPDWLTTSEPQTTAPVEAEAAPTGGLEFDWLGGASSGDLFANMQMPAEPESPTPEIEPATPGESGLDWLGGPSSDALFGNLESSPEPENAAPEIEPAMPSASGLDWLGGPSSDALFGNLESSPEPESAAPEIEPAMPSASGLDWLGGPSSDALFGNLESSVEPESAPPEPATTGESGLDWLGGPSSDDLFANLQTSAEPEGEAPDAAPAASDSDLGWLGGPSSDDLFANLQTSAEPEGSGPEAEPTATSESALDWLGGPSSDDLFANLQLPAEPEGEAPEAEPAATSESGLDWLGGPSSDDLFANLQLPAEPEGEAPEAEPAATSESSVDWLGGPSSDDLFANLQLPAEPESAAPEAEPAATSESSVDWLGGPSSDDLFANLQLPAEPEGAAPETEPATTSELGVDWLGGPSSEDLLANLQTPTEPQAEAGDWFSLEGDTALGDESVSGEVESGTGTLAPSEAPSWLASMAPSTGPAKPLEDLDFSSLSSPTSEETPIQQTPASESMTDSWLTDLRTEAEPAEPSPTSRGADWLSQSTAVPADEPKVELEEDWLASFESVTSPQTSSLQDEAPMTPPSSSGGDWLGSFATETPQAEPAQPADDWLSSLGMGQPQTVEPSSAVEDLLGAVPANEDWLSSFRADLGASIEETTEAQPADQEEFSEDMPDWMRAMPLVEQSGKDWAPTEIEDRVAPPIQSVAPPAGTSRPVNESGVLDPGALPDWLTAFGGEEGAADSGVTGAPLTADEGSPTGAPSAEPGKAAAWLSKQGQIEKPVAEQKTLADSTESGFTFDRVAQPANLVNTNAESSRQSFAFEQTPAWLRKKKKSSKGNPAASESTGDDLPDWLKEIGMR